MEKLKEKLKAALAKRKIQGDIYMEENSVNEIQVNEGEVEKITKADSFGAGIRVFKGGKMGTGYFTSKDPGEAEEIVDKALACAHIEGYGGYKMPSMEKLQPIRLIDSGFSRISGDEKKKMALDLEKAARSNPKVKYSRDTALIDNYSKIHFINSRGIDLHYEKSYFYAYTSAVAVDGAAQEVVDYGEGSVNLKDIDIEAIGRGCSEKAAGLLSGKPVKSGKYNLVLPPYVAADFLALLSRLFLSSNIRKGKSLLAGSKPGDKIGPEILTIRDDALMDFKSGSFPADGEGSAGRNKAVVESGRLNTFLYDIINAEYFKTASTGNSARADYKGLPECGVSNFYIQPGSGDARNETGILVNSMMGLHMTDTISGNFSLGINGWLLEKGAQKQPVKEILITGNIRDLLMKIGTVCGDLKFYGSYGSPTIVARDVMVAGK